MNASRRNRRPHLLRHALESLEERRLLATFTVTSNANTGVGTLRAAIIDANSAPGADTIVFSLPTNSRTITLASALPAISDPVTIDGTTQPGYIGAPRVEITGNNLVANGLTINASNSVVKGLAINAFARDNAFKFGRGIVLNGSNNTVENNYVGLRLDGITTLAVGRAGVELAGANNVVRNNTLTNTGYGVFIDSAVSGIDNNVVTGNYLGTIASGASTPAGVTAIGGIGFFSGNNNRVGGPAVADRNIIAIGTFAGIYFGAATTNPVAQNNYIGLNAAGTGALAGHTGIYVFAKSAQVRDNVIANATSTQLTLSSAENVTVAGNRVGMTATNIASGTGSYGIYVAANSINNRIGSPVAADRNWVLPGSISGINVLQSSDTTIQNNVVGMTPAGTVVSGNTAGIRVIEAGGTTTIGGTEINTGNIVSLTGQSTMIEVEDINQTGSSASVSVVGNQLGMNLAGTAAGMTYNNQSTGVSVAGSKLVDIRANHIANVATGIDNEGANFIRGNQLGLDASGLNPIYVGNGIHAIGGTVGGVGQGNLVGDWINYAITSSDGADVIVQGNVIGTNLDRTGSYIGAIGIASSVSAIIGGTNPGEGNLVTGSDTAIHLTGGTHKVQGNTLGQPGRPNARGIYLTVNGSDIENTLIGGDAAGAANTIAYNNSKAITLFASAGNSINNVTIRRNIIHSNGNLAIDLKNDGVTANDPFDADTGVNGLQNFPLLFSADSTGGAQTTVQGLISSSASTPIIVDFYSADAAANEARVWLGSRTLLTDSAGGATFTQTLPFVPGGKYIVATATSLIAAPNGATSELSPSVQVVGPADTTPPAVTEGAFEFETAQRVKLTFSEELLAGSIAASDLQMKNTTSNTTFTPSAFAYDAASKSITFTFNNSLTDGNYTWTLPAGAVSDLAGNATASLFNGNTHVLAGDANRDKAVNFDDLLVLAQNYGSSNRTFSQGDFNYDGAVNFDDLLLLAQRYGSTMLFGDAPIEAKPATTAKSRPNSAARDVLA